LLASGTPTSRASLQAFCCSTVETLHLLGDLDPLHASLQLALEERMASLGSFRP